jgi:hypothetical protein
MKHRERKRRRRMRMMMMSWIEDVRPGDLIEHLNIHLECALQYRAEYHGLDVARSRMTARLSRL